MVTPASPAISASQASSPGRCSRITVSPWASHLRSLHRIQHQGNAVIIDRLSATIASAAGALITARSCPGVRQAGVIRALAFALPVPLRLAAVAEAFNRGLLRRAGLAQCETVATVMPDLSGHPAAPKAHNRKIGRHGQRSRFTLTVANIWRFGVIAVKEPDLGSVEPDHHRGPHRTRLRRLVGMHLQLRPGPRSPRRRQHHHLPHARDHLPRAPVAAAAPAGNASPAHGMVPRRRG
jgi:hypothetical protein